VRATYRKVKELCKDFGVDVNINPVGLGYVLSYRHDNIVYGPWRARNLKDCLKLAMDIVDHTRRPAAAVEQTVLYTNAPKPDEDEKVTS